jgi:hypothetical protein
MWALFEDNKEKRHAFYGVPFRKSRYSRYCASSGSVLERFRKMLAARLTKTAMPIQIIQFESGPVLKTKESVQPKLSARLHATTA